MERVWNPTDRHATVAHVQSLRSQPRHAGRPRRPRLHARPRPARNGHAHTRAIAAPLAPGKWSPREIVAHLADCELAHSFRLRQILAAPASEPAVLQPFDQDAWAQHYAAYDLASALELFRANRLWNLKLIGTLSQADLDRPAHHPERGNLTFQIQLETMAGHDLNHVAQLQRLSAPASAASPA